MLNLRTHHVIVSRDIIWLNCMHGDDTPTTLLPQQDKLFEDDIEPQPNTVPSAPKNPDNLQPMDPLSQPQPRSQPRASHVNYAIFKATSPLNFLNPEITQQGGRG